MARYHQSKKDRKHESRGMDHALHETGMRQREYYAGVDPRRTQEMEDAGMIKMDMHAIANLPQDVQIKPYAYDGPYLPEGLDDTIRGVDHQIDRDDRGRAHHNVPKKV